MNLPQVMTAQSLVSRLSLDLVAAAAARRQGVGRGDGDRSQPSLAAAPVDLVEIFEPAPGRARLERVTTPGQRTARRRAPAFLSRYPRSDGRRLAAEAYLAALERLGAVGGVDFSAEAEIRGSSPGVSDGGATSRVRDAALVRMVRGRVNRWKWSRARRSYVTGPSRVVLAPQRGSDRRPITALDLLDGLLVEGLSLAEILRRFGWSVQSKQRQKLTESAEEMIEEIADLTGLTARISRR
ncbi:hypothetical protein [Roseovarius sp. C03]|uniref:hypothetical protein n=1 Tax=Roseovarius sp. C03 TaxID=3449222 RepID=UPI003EDC1B5E